VSDHGACRDRSFDEWFDTFGIHVTYVVIELHIFPATAHWKYVFAGT
jgi:hypothetical protein